MSNANPDTNAKPTIAQWPPVDKPRQVTRTELAQMTPGAIEMARQAGALEDLLAGKEAK